MTRTRWILALLLGVIFRAEASGQFFPLPVIIQNGIDFHYSSRHLKINGFFATGNPYGAVVPVVATPFGPMAVGPAYFPYPYGYPGYGSVDQRITVQIINPPILVQRRRGLQPYIEQYDLSGIDLDVESASRIWGEKPALAKGGKGLPPKKGEFVKAPKKKEEIAKLAPPAEKKPQVAANVVKPAPAPKVEPAPKVDPVPEGQRLHDLGVAAFRQNEYGLAMLRFRQAVNVEPPEPRALFLHGQAFIAVGKYREAAEIIQLGLQLQPNWPKSGFRPQLELYDNQEDSWKDHRKGLEDAQRLQPQNADFLFLLGYVSWFDGQRASAVDYFQQARALAADPSPHDAFLKVAAAKN